MIASPDQRFRQRYSEYDDLDDATNDSNDATNQVTAPNIPRQKKTKQQEKTGKVVSIDTALDEENYAEFVPLYKKLNNRRSTTSNQMKKMLPGLSLINYASICQPGIQSRLEKLLPNKKSIKLLIKFAEIAKDRHTTH